MSDMTEMPEEKSIAETSKQVLERILELMGISAVVTASVECAVETGEEAPTCISLDVQGEDLGILIGWHGQTLASLEYIVRLVAGSQTQNRLLIVIDIEGYRKRRQEALRALALRIAEQVKATGTPFTMEPMPASERRAIHLALANHPDVTTQSTGFGFARKVMVLPKPRAE